MASARRPRRLRPMSGYVEGRPDEVNQILVNVPDTAFKYAKGKKCLLRLQAFERDDIDESHRNFELDRLRDCCKRYMKDEMEWPDLFQRFMSTSRAIKGIVTSIHYEGTITNRTWTHVQPLRDDRFKARGGKVRRWEYSVAENGRLTFHQ